MAGAKTGISGQINNNIVTDGLVFYMDPAYKKSYPGTGTIISNIAENNSGSLNGSGGGNNSPQFQNTNGGILDFDGTDDRINIQGINTGPYSSLGANTTCHMWVNFDGGTAVLIGGSSYNNGGYFFYASPSSAYSSYGGSFDQGTWTSFGDEVWINYCVTKNDSGNIIWYGNGQQLDTGTAPTAGASIGFWAVGAYNGGNFAFNGQMGPVQVYTRALSAGEVLQNYQAQKERFGL